MGAETKPIDFLGPTILTFGIIATACLTIAAQPIGPQLQYLLQLDPVFVDTCGKLGTLATGITILTTALAGLYK